MIPMVDLQEQFEEIKDEVFKVTETILRSSRYILGPHVTELEEKGLVIENRFTGSDGAMVTAKASDGNLEVNLALSVDGDQTQAIVNFTEK